MNKRILKYLIMTLSCLMILGGCSAEDKTPAHYIEDLKTTDVDMRVYVGFTEAEHQFRKLTLQEANRIYAEGGSGILYYGYTDCPWCTQAVPIMNEVAQEYGLTIYYVDMKNKDGNTEEIYNELVGHVEEFLQKEDGEPVFFVPQVFVVKNGKIVGDHLSTVDSYKPSQGNMNDKQKSELKKIYEKMFVKLKGYPAPAPQVNSPEAEPTPEISAVPENEPSSVPEAESTPAAE